MKKPILVGLFAFTAFIVSASTASAQQTSTPKAAESNSQRTSTNEKVSTTRPTQTTQPSSAPTSTKPVLIPSKSGTPGQQPNTPKPAQDNSDRGRTKEQ